MYIDTCIRTYIHMYIKTLKTHIHTHTHTCVQTFSYILSVYSWRADGAGTSSTVASGDVPAPRARPGTPSA